MLTTATLRREIRSYPGNLSYLSSAPDNQGVLPEKYPLPNAILKDQIELTETADATLEERTQKLLDTLSQNFPGITFTYASDKTFVNLKKEAASLGYGKHLVLSEAFLARMSRSEQDFKDCKAILISSALSLTDNQADGVYLGETLATPWKIGKKEEDPSKETLSQMLENLKQTNASSKNDFRMSTSNISYQTGPLYTKLAQSGNKQLVQSVMSEAYRNIASLRLVSCLGESEDRAKAQKAIRSLQRLLTRGRQKVKQLDRETLLSIRKKRALKRREEEKARELAKELKKQRNKRRNNDKIIEKEGRNADWEIERMKNYFPSMDISSFPMDTGGAVGSADISAAAGGTVSCEQISMDMAVAF